MGKYSEDADEFTREKNGKKATAVFSSTEDNLYPTSSTVTWAQALYFPCEKPHKTLVTIEVKTRIGKGVPETIGKVTKNVSSLLQSETRRTEIFDGDLGRGCKLEECMIKIWFIGPHVERWESKPQGSWERQE